MSGLVPAAGEETFWCPNMLSLVSFAGMTLNKDMDVNWRPCAGRVTLVLVKESHIQTHSRTSVCGRTYLVSLTEKTAFIKKKKKKKKSLPTLPYFFGVLILNTHIFSFGPTKHAKHFEKNGWTDLCRINPGSILRLPHTHRFTSLKNVVIAALHKIDKRLNAIVKGRVCKKKKKKKKKHNVFLVQIKCPVTQDNCSASLCKPRDAEQLPSWQNFQSATHSH